jgi:hypothetical protein
LGRKKLELRETRVSAPQLQEGGGKEEGGLLRVRTRFRVRVRVSSAAPAWGRKP